MKRVTAEEVEKMLAMMMILAGFQIAGTELSSDIRIVHDVNNTSTALEGVLQLKYNDLWYSVCYNGYAKIWGNKEAAVACRQLQYKGGWPVSIPKTSSEVQGPHRYLSDFDCKGTETEIKACDFNVGDPCTELAGIQCYSFFEVKLANGIAPNAGRVEVKYDGAWSNVCYEFPRSQTRKWEFHNVQVVCQELGFPGAMFARQGGMGKGTRATTVDGFRCSIELQELSLNDCLPNSPKERSTQDPAPSCGVGNTGESNDAVAVCAVPGYIGCFNNISNTSGKLQMANMTINVCRKYCSRRIYTHAFLHKGDTCSCGNETVGDPIGDAECRQECTGDRNQVCGDSETFSVYYVMKGQCSDPLNKTDIYYYGDTIDSFGCGPGRDPVSVQCIMGNSSDDMNWNAIFPTCTDVHVLTDHITDAGNNKLSTVMIDLKNNESKETWFRFFTSVMLAIVIIVLFAVFVFCWRKYYVKQRLNNNDRDIDNTPETTATIMNGFSVNNPYHTQSSMIPNNQEITNNQEANSSEESVYYEIPETSKVDSEESAYGSACAEIQSGQPLIAGTSSRTTSSDKSSGTGDSAISKQDSLHYGYTEIINRNETKTTESIKDCEASSVKYVYEEITYKDEEGWEDNKIYDRKDTPVTGDCKQKVVEDAAADSFSECEEALSSENTVNDKEGWAENKIYDKNNSTVNDCKGRNSADAATKNDTVYNEKSKALSFKQSFEGNTDRDKEGWVENQIYDTGDDAKEWMVLI